MKKIVLLCFQLLAIVLINGVVDVVECRPHRGHRQQRKDDYYMMLVFGDSLVDAGNTPPPPVAADDDRGRSRQWLYPYGTSDQAHRNHATGRLSDGLVQSDFLARIVLGQTESPPAYRRQQANDDDEVDPSGVNFAMAGSGVSSPGGLSHQIDQLSRLVRRGSIEDSDLDHSVALIAFTGDNDYARLDVATPSDQIMSVAEEVTDMIAAGVRRLQELGVSKVLVDLMPPMGCQPYRTWMTNYAQCDSNVNTVSSIHNTLLRRKMEEIQDVLLLDLDSTFTQLNSEFKGRYTPCCDATSKPEGYCGQEDSNGKAQYSLCPNPEDFFYWDYVHPTQAGWEAVMNRLEQPILNFLA